MSLTVLVIKGVVAKFLGSTPSAAVKLQAGSSPGYHIGNMVIKSLFSSSITCCTSEPCIPVLHAWSRAEYGWSNQISKQFWHEPWSEHNTP